jgi:hypothetical protein
MDGMRLPQSIIQSLSVRSFHFLTFAAALLVCFIPGNAGAATPQLSCSPSSLGFGALDVGQTEALLVTLTNNGQTRVTISGLAVSNSEFATSTMTLPVTLLAGQSVDLNVSFTPRTTGWTSGNITFTSNASNPTLIVQVQGRGVATVSLTASPSTLAF